MYKEARFPPWTRPPCATCKAGCWYLFLGGCGPNKAWKLAVSHACLPACLLALLPQPQEASKRTRRLCATAVDTMGREIMVKGQVSMVAGGGQLLD